MEDTISVTDKKISLSRRSPMPKKCLRKSMLLPYETIRPICTDAKEIEDLMKRLLAPFKRGQDFSWSKFQEMIQEERRPLEKKEVLNVWKTERDQLVYGVNEVCSGIEKHSLCSVLISEDVAPAFIMDFILDMATVHRVPILILPNLRKLTQETIGFSSSCLGFKLYALQSKSFFNPLHLKIKEVLKEYKPPKNVIFCQCPARKAEKTGPDWPCDLNPMPDWNIKNEESKKKKIELLKHQPGSDSVDSFPSTSNILLELEGGQEEEASSTSAPKRLIAEDANIKKSNAAHPYLRPFLWYLRSMKSRKKKCPLTTAGSNYNLGVMDVTQVKMERKQNETDYFQPLKLTDD